MDTPKEFPTDKITIDLHEAARLLGCKIHTIRHLIWSGKIRHAKLGKKFVVCPLELREYMQRQLVRL
jgi:excisionase family DNA binding protein